MGWPEKYWAENPKNFYGTSKNIGREVFLPLSRLSSSLGFVYKKPKHVPRRADAKNRKTSCRIIANFAYLLAKTKFSASAMVVLHDRTVLAEFAAEQMKNYGCENLNIKDF